jgi:hypothetical protein
MSFYTWEKLVLLRQQDLLREADQRRFVEAVLSQPAAPGSMVLAGLGEHFGDVGQQLQQLANAS